MNFLQDHREGSRCVKQAELRAGCPLSQRAALGKLARQQRALAAESAGAVAAFTPTLHGKRIKLEVDELSPGQQPGRLHSSPSLQSSRLRALDLHRPPGASRPPPGSRSVQASAEHLNKLHQAAHLARVAQACSVAVKLGRREFVGQTQACAPLCAR